MKTYTEFETEQELRDYLDSLCGVNVEMEAKMHKGKWQPFLSDDVLNMVGCPTLRGFKARVLHPPVHGARPVRDRQTCAGDLGANEEND